MISILYQNEIIRLLKSRRFKVMLSVMLLPVVVYFFTHEEITEYGVKALERSFQINMSEFMINFWMGVIGQLIVIILMSDLLASEIDKGTMRLLLTKPIRKSEIVIGKFSAGMTALAVLYGIPYLTMQIYGVLLYKSGFEGFTSTLNDFLFALGVTLLLLGSLGAFAMFLSIIVARPLYASLASFAVVFIAQFIIPSLPFFDNPERFNLSYQVGVLLKKGFSLHTGLDAYKGDPNMSALFFLSIILISLILTLVGIYRKEYEG
ncbi:ABC transporter permease [Palaeococcus pacificus DY20341]|uniref:ABC transporter permease n=1 Tax=Palaeococcus pacificus DY20341 TaxID=1343739 RepID=A0A075LYH1_9EURY|nr:ABC transporter permease [Palaeococcus pacificus]AIF69623.1 ABC transporter permease [Palaeococcus pacificus DY20341]